MSDPQTPTSQEAIRGVAAKEDAIPLLRKMVAQGKARNDPTLAVALSIGMLDALLVSLDEAIAIGAKAAEEDAARLAEALRQYRHPTITGTVWRQHAEEALRLHDERVKP